MILNDISDDSKFVEIASTAFNSEILFEGDLDVWNVLSIPPTLKKAVSKSHDHQVLSQFFPQVMINSIHLFFLEKESKLFR